MSTQVLRELSNVLFKKFAKSWKEIEAVIRNVTEEHVIEIHEKAEVDVVCLGKSFCSACYSKTFLVV